MRLPYGQQLRAALVREEPGSPEKALACLAACWAEVDGLHPSQLMSASLAQLQDRSLCARDVVELLSQSGQGRKALSDLGFESVLQHVEGE